MPFKRSIIKPTPTVQDKIVTADKRIAGAVGLVEAGIAALDQASAEHAAAYQEIETEIARLTELSAAADDRACDAQLLADNVRTLLG